MSIFSNKKAERPSPTAIIYQSELDFMSRCILDYPNIETGGELFGFWTPDGTPVVLYAVGPGPNARHHATAFVQDPDYVDRYEAEMCLATRLQHIGQWHSHHQLDLARPSGGDVGSMLRGVGQPGFPRMLLCIGNCTPAVTTVNAFNFHEADPCRYVHAAWDVVPMESPFRPVVDRMYAGRFYTPRTPCASHGRMYTVDGRAVGAPAPRQHWLVECVEHVQQMKGFVADCREYFGDHSPVTEILDTGEPVIAVCDDSVRIMLPYGFPGEAPRFMAPDDEALNEAAARMWRELADMPLPQRFPLWLQTSYNEPIKHFI